ncbi:MAG: cytochrome c oxidase assembly protein [Thermoleophilia bacterium]|nr:cytochrome c oxidase assembly protein [Thermoleophilia bacterium]MDH5334292.1 cytochrome c oxidase assembly protein [Thermoleophilia bacterium]
MRLLAETSPWLTWTLSPLVLAGAVVAVVFFFQGFHRLRRRGRADLAPWSRAALFLSGVAITVFALVGPLDTIAEEYLQTAHMLQHVLIADLGVALTLVAVRGPLAVFFLPRGLLVPLAHTRWARRALALLLRPWVGYVLWVGALVAWHIPPAYEAALVHPVVHTLEHLSFVVAGLLVWTQIVDPTGHRRLSVGERAGYVALLFWTGQILAYVIAFATEPLYDAYVDQPERLLGLSPLTDQKLSAVVMMVEQALTLGVAFVILYRIASTQRSGPAAEPAG